MTVTLNRRAALFGAAVSTAALAVPAAAAVARPVYVKVGSPSFSVSPEVMAAIQRWRTADTAATEAADGYAASTRVQPIDKDACGRAYRAMVNANQEEHAARAAMILALRRGGK